MQLHTHMPLHTPKTLQMCKKVFLVFKKLQGVRQMARLKQQHFFNLSLSTNVLTIIFEIMKK